MIPLYGFLDCTPKQSHQGSKAQEVAALQAETEDYQNKIRQLKDLDELLSNPAYDGVLERVPTTLEQETFILLYNESPRAQGLFLIVFHLVKELIAPWRANTIKANFSISGRMDKFPDFLEAVEKSHALWDSKAFLTRLKTLMALISSKCQFQFTHLLNQKRINDQG